MYQLIDNNRVRKMPEMKEPQSSDFHRTTHEGIYQSYDFIGHDKAKLKYQEELAKQPTYPISGNHNWKEGQLIPDDEIEIFDSNTYYWAVCDKCGWTGSSENLNGGGQIADSGDYGDVYCPKCNNSDIGENDDYPNYVGTVAIPKQAEPSTGSEEDEISLRSKLRLAIWGICVGRDEEFYNRHGEELVDALEKSLQPHHQ